MLYVSQPHTRALPRTPSQYTIGDNSAKDMPHRDLRLSEGLASGFAQGTPKSALRVAPVAAPQAKILDLRGPNEQFPMVTRTCILFFLVSSKFLGSAGRFLGPAGARVGTRMGPGSHGAQGLFLFTPSKKKNGACSADSSRTGAGHRLSLAIRPLTTLGAIRPHLPQPCPSNS